MKFKNLISSNRKLQQQLIDVILETRGAEDDSKSISRGRNAISLLIYSQFNFIGMDLSGIRVPNTDLSNGNFCKANLSESNLSGCKVEDADFSWSNLTGANLLDITFKGQ